MRIPNEPICATPQWRAAVIAAKLRCQCRRGECGKAHAKSGGECDQAMNDYVDVRLHLVVDAGRGEIVVCADCYDGRKTIANRKAKAAADARAKDERFALFPLEAQP